MEHVMSEEGKRDVRRKNSEAEKRSGSFAGIVCGAAWRIAAGGEQMGDGSFP